MTSDQATEESGKRPGWPAAMAVSFALLGTLSSFHPMLLSGFDRMQADPIDTRFNHYVLEHTLRWITGRAEGGLWSPPFFYPHPNVLAYSDNLLGAAPLYWLLRMAAPADLAYALWLIACSALSYAAYLFVARRLGICWPPTIAGAYWFAYGLPRSLLINHPQLLPSFFAPLALLAVVRFLAAPSVTRLAIVLALILAQLWAAIYLGWFLALGIGVLGVAWLAIDAGGRTTLLAMLRRRWPALVLIGAGVVVALLPMALPYAQARADVGPRSFAQVDPYLPRLRSWLPDYRWPAWRAVVDTMSAPIPRPTENMQFFQGYAFWAILAGGAWVLLARRGRLKASRRTVASAMLIAGVVLLLLCLRFSNGWTLWKAVYAVVPGAGAIRAVSRMYATVYLLAGTGALLALDGWLRRISLSGLAGRALAMGLLIVVALEQGPGTLPSYERAPVRQRIARLRALMSGADVAYVAHYGSTRPGHFVETQLDAMWAGLEAGVPVVNGYSGAAPRDYLGYRAPFTPATLAQWLGRESPATVVVIAAAETDLAADWKAAASEVIQGEDYVAVRVRAPKKSP